MHIRPTTISVLGAVCAPVGNAIAARLFAGYLAGRVEQAISTLQAVPAGADADLLRRELLLVLALARKPLELERRAHARTRPAGVSRISR